MPSAHKFARDRIFIDSLRLRCACGTDAFGRLKPQPVLLSVELGTLIARAAADDNVGLSVDYSAIAKELNALDNQPFERAIQLINLVLGLALKRDGVERAKVNLSFEKGILAAKRINWTRSATFREPTEGEWNVHVEGIEVHIIIGINENLHERTQMQPIVIDLTWTVPCNRTEELENINFQREIASIVHVRSELEPSDILESIRNIISIHRITRDSHLGTGS